MTVQLAVLLFYCCRNAVQFEDVASAVVYLYRYDREDSIWISVAAKKRLIDLLSSFEIFWIFFCLY